MDERRCSEPLDAADTRLFRSTRLRLANLSGDRPDICFAVKELARQSKEPRQIDLLGVKRLTRYLIGCPRQVLVMPRQSRPRMLVAYTDSDHACCVVSRKSTSSYVLFWGRHCLRAGSGTQKVVATSSAEAEFYQEQLKNINIMLGTRKVFDEMRCVVVQPLLGFVCLGNRQWDRHVLVAQPWGHSHRAACVVLGAYAR